MLVLFMVELLQGVGVGAEARILRKSSVVRNSSGVSIGGRQVTPSQTQALTRSAQGLRSGAGSGSRAAAMKRTLDAGR
jgi:hypothetical protein